MQVAPEQKTRHKTMIAKKLSMSSPQTLRFADKVTYECWIVQATRAWRSVDNRKANYFRLRSRCCYISCNNLGKRYVPDELLESNAA